MKGTAKPVRWTYQDYLLFPDDGKRYEIICGERFVTPAPVPKHQAVLVNLLQALVAFVRRNDLGKCFVAPIDVLLAEDSVVQPDIIFISKDRLGIIGERAITGPPDLTIEVLSDSTRKMDYLAKRKLYAAYGVIEYWIVDPEVERVETFVLEGSDLVKKGESSEGGVSSLKVLPGLTISLREIFA